ncbi:hypothetical protein E2C01_004010 [Portunus trituberculatus]|uniref:Uncharacterized protein n=1 Tax=Portunus trituberculatus TaxID=210409 RepID=A0A5B7CNR3_PORTR|nr:hypothetical protein [Portunus trituberculatus]
MIQLSAASPIILHKLTFTSIQAYISSPSNPLLPISHHAITITTYLFPSLQLTNTSVANPPYPSFTHKPRYDLGTYIFCVLNHPSNELLTV